MGITRHIKDREIGPNVADLLRQLGGPDIRNNDIRNHQIQCSAELLEPGESLIAIASFINPMTLLLQYPNGQPRTPSSSSITSTVPVLHSPGNEPGQLVRSTGASARTWGKHIRLP